MGLAKKTVPAPDESHRASLLSVVQAADAAHTTAQTLVDNGKILLDVAHIAAPATIDGGEGGVAPNSNTAPVH